MTSSPSLRAASDDGSAATTAEARFELYGIVGLLLVATENLAIERGLGYSALNEAEPVAPAFLSALASRRESVDAALLEAVALARNGPAFHGRDWLLAELDTIIRSHAEIRKEMNDGLQQEEQARKKELDARWFREMTRLIAITEELSRNLQRQLTVDRKFARKALGIQRYAGVMSDFAGRERAFIGAAIAAKSRFSKDDSVRLRWYRNRVEAAWRAAEIWSKDAGLDTELQGAFDRVRKEFFGAYEAIRLSVYKSGRLDGKFSISTEEWFDHANRGIESIVQLRRAATAVGDRESSATHDSEEKSS